MSCDEEALNEYCDGELAPERRAAIEGHLASCLACRAVLERLKAGSAAFRAHGAVKAPQGLASAVLDRPLKETSGREARWAPVAVLASLTLVVFLSGKALKPQISGIFNQCMGMISGAASSVGSAGGPSSAPSPASPLWLVLAVLCLAFALAFWWKQRKR
ncbi:MAG: zf-HC2 domain-containing protein [Elusimicrobia bacterium]|nr:zf-HC2 domain-containing protein [Elusimicrobiota bacterium]